MCVSPHTQCICMALVDCSGIWSATCWLAVCRYTTYSDVHSEMSEHALPQALLRGGGGGRGLQGVLHSYEQLWQRMNGE